MRSSWTSTTDLSLVLFWFAGAAGRGEDMKKERKQEGKREKVDRNRMPAIQVNQEQ